MASNNRKKTPLPTATASAQQKTPAGGMRQLGGHGILRKQNETPSKRSEEVKFAANIKEEKIEAQNPAPAPARPASTGKNTASADKTQSFRDEVELLRMGLVDQHGKHSQMAQQKASSTPAQTQKK